MFNTKYRWKQDKGSQSALLPSLSPVFQPRCLSQLSLSSKNKPMTGLMAQWIKARGVHARGGRREPLVMRGTSRRNDAPRTSPPGGRVKEPPKD